MNASQAPVFILSSAGRTGSTLLQRLLISTRDIMVWGEHDGAMVAAAGQFHDEIVWLLAVVDRVAVAHLSGG